MKVTGIEATRIRLTNIAGKLDKNASKVMTKSAKTIIENARINCPEDEADLVTTIRGEKEKEGKSGRLSIVLTFGGEGKATGRNTDPYAMIIHENYEGMLKNGPGPITLQKMAKYPDHIIGSHFLTRAVTAEAPKINENMIFAVKESIELHDLPDPGDMNGNVLTVPVYTPMKTSNKGKKDHVEKKNHALTTKTHSAVTGGDAGGTSGRLEAVRREGLLPGEAGYRRSAEEHEGLMVYTSGQYQMINGALRDAKGDDSKHETYAKRIANLDAAFKNGSYTSAQTVFRGTELPGKYANLKAGDVIHDYAFTSTSKSATRAKSFGRDFFTISVPEGARGIDVHSEGRTQYPHEQEVTFDRGTSLRVTGVTQTERGRQITAELFQ